MLFEQSGIGTQDDFRRVIGNKPFGIFIRSILGLDRNSANSLFSSFLSNEPLSSHKNDEFNFMR